MVFRCDFDYHYTYLPRYIYYLMCHSGALNPIILTAWCLSRPKWINAFATLLKKKTFFKIFTYREPGKSL